MKEIKVYEFSTFQEFFERVPTDRMADCLAELAINFFMAKSMIGVINPLAKSLGGSEYKSLFKMPLVWRDDKRGDIKTILEFSPDAEGKPHSITIIAERKKRDEKKETP